MHIGTLRKQVTIQAEQSTSDGAGGYALAWSAVATVWAEITPVGGHKLYAFGHLEGRVTHKITLRWRGDLTLTSAMRIVYGTRSFNIHAVMNRDESNQWADLLVEEGGGV